MLITAGGPTTTIAELLAQLAVAWRLVRPVVWIAAQMACVLVVAALVVVALFAAVTGLERQLLEAGRRGERRRRDAGRPRATAAGEVECSLCNGEGLLADADRDCPKCDGGGRVEAAA